MHHGLGKSNNLLDTSQLEHMGRATFVSQICFILSVATAKASVAALMLRLFTRDMKVTRKSWVLCHSVLALTIAWAVGSVVAISVTCNPSAFLLDTANSCSNQVLRWRIITAFDVFIELLLILLPVFFIWPIQMKGYIKLQVVVAFGFRAPIIGFAIAHLHYVSDYANSSNTSKVIISALVYQHFELFWSLLAATVPTLKAFMRSFNSGFGMEIDLDGYGTGYGSGGTYPLESLRNATSQNGTVVSKPGVRERGREANNTGTAGTASEGASIRDGQTTTTSSGMERDGSQELIIQKETTWTIHHDARSRSAAGNTWT
ncbi:hypothetical protein EJ04DRAFT_99675 [Polyplosphaeria fusca]|uniref:Rhodopsin domain-containing protein n=1 Tax=Polyplosphaeria fusca TaxID=682080 RepID=A0A9P4QNX3_9PLEO|nr:hypothetical protein EJ04DRAFT_99675 [Polyplosphaeria fusca]